MYFRGASACSSAQGPLPGFLLVEFMNFLWGFDSDVGAADDPTHLVTGLALNILIGFRIVHYKLTILVIRKCSFLEMGVNHQLQNYRTDKMDVQKDSN